MTFRPVVCLLLAALVLAAGCGKKPAENAVAQRTLEIDPLRGHLLHAQPKLPTIQVWVGGEQLTAEVARRPVEIATGMMFRTNMNDGEAMLFVFADAAPRNFYMRNCYIPLSGAYIDPNGEILQIIKMDPHDELGIPSTSANVQFVLEVPQGWFERHNVGVGAIVRTEHGSLRDTFFGQRNVISR